MSATPDMATRQGDNEAPPAREAAAPSPSHAPAPGSGRPPETLKKRREFLAAARARRAAMPSLILQGRRRNPGDEADDRPPRVGYTCSKKVGGAVERNRAKRRLRAAAAAVIPMLGLPGWDYVLIGRREATAARPWPALLADLEKALGAVHGRTGR